MNCPHVRTLRSLANMSPKEIRAWVRSRAKCPVKPRTSGATAVEELETLAVLLQRPARTSAECKKAQDAVAFIKRHEAGRKRDKNHCSLDRVIALRDWAYHPKGCPVPPSGACKRKER